MLPQNTKLKIAVNCWVLRNKDLDGIGHFTVNVISRIIRSHPEVDFLIMCDRNFTENYFDFVNVKKYKVFPSRRHPLLYLIWMEFVVSFFLKKHKPDLFISSDGFLSLLSDYRQLPVIHDLNFVHYPQDLKLKNRLYYNFFFKRFAKKAKRIATVSAYSKMDIIKQYHIPAEKIDTVFNGINKGFYVLSEEEKMAARKKYSDGRPYFFFVGSVHPRKNLTRLLNAFGEFKKHTGSDFKLVIAGAMLWGTSEILKAWRESAFENDIYFTGRLTDQDLSQALGAAYALTFIPVFEGFGIPIIEAFEAGVPALVSNVTSLPEVAGDAAVYVNPFDVDSITNGMTELYENKNNICNKLVEKGFVQKQNFSWDKTAILLWQSMIKAIR